MSKLDMLVNDESVRNSEFPVTRDRIYMAHAGVCPLPKVTADAMTEFIEHGSRAELLADLALDADGIEKACRAMAKITTSPPPLVQQPPAAK